MEAPSAPNGPRFTNTMLNPLEPVLSFFTPGQLAEFIHENVDDPIAQKIADFIIVTRMCGRDFIYMTQEDLQVLSKGLPAITEMLTSFQVETMIPSPRGRFRPLDDIFFELSTSSSASSNEQVTSDMESNHWSSAPSRSPSPDGSLSSADDESYHDASPYSINTSSPLLSPPSSPPHPLQVVTDLSLNPDVTVLDFAFSTLDDDELRSLYLRSTTHLMAMIYQVPGVNETDAPLPDFPANNTTSPPTLASITPGASWDAWDLWDDTGSIAVSKYIDFEREPPAGMSSSSPQRVPNSEVSHPSCSPSGALASLQPNDEVPDISQMDEIEGSEPEWSDDISNADLHALNEDVSSVAIGNDIDTFSGHPPLDLGDASPRTVTIHDRTEPCSPSVYNFHDTLPPLAGPFSSVPGFESQRNSPFTPHRVEIVGARRWDLSSEPPSLPTLFPTSPEGSWGPGVSIPTVDQIASRSLFSTTSTAARSFFALQVPQEWLSKDSDEIDMRPSKPQITPGFRANFSDRTAPMSLLSPIHGQSDDEIDDEDIVTLDLGGDSTSPGLLHDIPTYSLLDDDEISPLLFSPPSVPTRSHINHAVGETLHDRKLSLDATDRTLWPSGSVAYRHRTLSSPTIVRRVLKIPIFDDGMAVTGPRSAMASTNVANQLPEFSSTESKIDRKTFLEYPSATRRNGWGKQLRNWLRSIGTPPVQSPQLKRTRSLLSPRAKIEITDSRLLPIIRGPLSATEPTPDVTPATFA